MKNIRFIITLVQTLILLSGLVNSLLAESSSAQLKLQKAYFAERSEGDLDKAIKLYQDVINQSDIDKQYIAQAAYQLGCCFEKKGETANAVPYYQKVVSEYPGVEKWYDKAKLKLDGLEGNVETESSFDNGIIPQSLIPYLQTSGFAAYLESVEENIFVNYHIHLVENDFRRYFGGITTLSQYLSDGRYSLGNFGGKSNIKVYDKYNNLLEVEWGKAANGLDMLIWNAGKKIEDHSELHYFYYTSGKSHKMKIENDCASLRMCNHYGDEVLELFFLVLPESLDLVETDVQYTDKQYIDGFYIYTWKKRNPKNTNNIVNMTIKSVTKASKADQLESEELSAQGWKLWKERKLSEAEDAFVKAVELNPDNENGWQGLGWAQLNQGKRENAKASFEKCVELNPENSAALNGLGWIADGQGSKDEAIEWWKKAVKAQPGATASLSGLVDTYAERKDNKNTVKYLEIWLKAEPDNEEVKKKLSKFKAGDSRQNTGKADKGKSKELSAQGWKLWKERKLSEAEDAFVKAVELDSGNENGWQGLGWSQLNQGKQDDARVSFEKCAELNPKNSAALNGLGWIASGKGDDDEAIKWWEKAVKAQPGATASLSGLVDVYMEREDYQNAEKYLKMWQKVDPKNVEVKDKLDKLKGK